MKVTVVIPTIGRPELQVAINSALEQSHSVHEVLVMADTVAPIELPNDPRVRILRVGPQAGGNVARQRGIEAATGDVIALLDDDDRWMPRKIELQLQAAAMAPDPDNWISACRAEAREGAHLIDVWPTRAILSSESLPSYLFRKTKVRGGTGMMQASMLVFPRDLALRVPFDTTLRFHQDISWLVDVSHAVPKVVVSQVWLPLSVYEVSVKAKRSVSQSIQTKNSILWAKHRLKPDGPRILGDFILTHSLYLPRREGSIRGVVYAISQGVIVGRPGIPALGYAAVTLIRVTTARMRKRHP